MKILKASVLAVLLVFLLIFVSQNHQVLAQPVVFELNLVFARWRTVPVPLGGYLLVAFLVGYFFAFLVTLGERVKLRMELKRAKKSEDKATRTSQITSATSTPSQESSTGLRKFDG